MDYLEMAQQLINMMEELNTVSVPYGKDTALRLYDLKDLSGRLNNQIRHITGAMKLFGDAKAEANVGTHFECPHPEGWVDMSSVTENGDRDCGLCLVCGKPAPAPLPF